MLEKLELEDLPTWERLNQQPLTHTQMTALRGGFEFKILNLPLDRLDEFAFLIWPQITVGSGPSQHLTIKDFH